MNSAAGTFSPPNHLSMRKGKRYAFTCSRADSSSTDDTQQVRRALARDASAFRTIMQTHNRSVYRIARSILRNNADAEDAVQQAYVSAFTNLRAIAAKEA